MWKPFRRNEGIAGRFENCEKVVFSKCDPTGLAPVARGFLHYYYYYYFFFSSFADSSDQEKSSAKT